MKNTINIYNNDIYFFEIINDKIIINNNYKGILIYDKNFNLIKSLDIYDNISIDYYIKSIKYNNIILFSYETNIIVYIDLNSYNYKLILLNEDNYEEYIFSSIAEYYNDYIILVDYNKKAFFKLDIVSSTISKLDNFKSSNTIFEEINLKFNKILKDKDEVYIQEIFLDYKKVIFNINKKLFLMDFSNKNLEIMFQMPRNKFHDFEIFENYLVKISERKVVFIDIYEGKSFNIFPKSRYYFIRGKFINYDNKLYFYLISISYKSNQSRIYKFEIK